MYRFEVARGLAGAELTAISGGLRDALGVKQGLLVIRVAPQSVAANAGLRDGDIIVKANGRTIDDIPALSRAMREHDATRTLALETLRARKKRMVRLTW
jgi:serine protease Do